MDVSRERCEVLALWRESGEWWSFEPYREYCRFIDRDGIRRESSTDLSPFALPDDSTSPYVENNREDLDLRVGKDGRGAGRGEAPAAQGVGFGVWGVGEDEVQGAGLGEDTGTSPLREGPSTADLPERSRSFAPAKAGGVEGGGVRSPLPLTPYPLPHADFRIRKTRDEKVAKACGYESVALEGECHPDRSEAVGLPRCPWPGRDLTGVDSRTDLNMEARTRFPPDSSTPLGMTDRNSNTTPSYAPLHILSGYAFGRSTMLAEEIPVLAAERGIPAAAIADPFSLAGAVEFVRSARKAGVKPLVGASFEMEDGGEIVLLAKTKTGYRSLSRLITECHLNEPRLFPLCTWERLARHAQDLICLTGGHRGPLNLLLAGRNYEPATRKLERLIGLYGRENLFIEIERSFVPWEIGVERALLEMAEKTRVMPVAGGAITHAKPEHFSAQDVLVCIETLCTVDEIVGRKPQRDPDQPQIKPIPERALNCEHFFRSPREMEALFADRSDLLQNTLAIAAMCDDDVLPGRTQLPRLYDGDDAQVLCDVVTHGALRYHGKIAPGLKKRLDHELKRIIRLDFARHFLVAWDVCRWSKEQEILLSGRGSVVDSAVAYCLGISRIDAYAHKLHFDRFLPADGSKRPDIDIDFEAKRRDDVRNHMAAKYGDDKVATVAAFGAYCTRGIVRGVGKVFGIPDETIGYLSKRIHGGVQADQLEAALEKRPELRNSDIPKERFQWVFRLVKQLMDVPTNFRAHSSGVVVSSEPLADTVPVMQSGADGVKIIQWDKRSAKYYFDKFDILCLRGQDVLSGTQRFAREHDPDFDAEKVPIDDPETFRTMRSGQLIGIPQSASPAMRQAHVRLRTENLHDASLVQAGIRPGVGGAVKLNELIMRRRGLHSYSFEHPLLEKILGFTYGIIVFQEQVDQLLQAFCGYTSGEAEDIRDAIHKKRREDYSKKIRDEVFNRVLERGFGISVAEKVYDYVAGFQGYGFAQGHALAFAEISIRSIWCQQNMPSEYFAALLNAQPAGYYGPCTLANEARVRGVAVLPPDVNLSEVDFSVEDVQSKMDPKIVVPRGGVRTGLMQIGVLSKGTRERIAGERRYGLYDSIFDFCARVHPARDELEALIQCGAFDRVNDNRRLLLWAVPQAVAWGQGEAPMAPGRGTRDKGTGVRGLGSGVWGARPAVACGLEGRALHGHGVVAAGCNVPASGSGTRDAETGQLGNSAIGQSGPESGREDGTVPSREGPSTAKRRRGCVIRDAESEQPGNWATGQSGPEAGGEDGTVPSVPALFTSGSDRPQGADCSRSLGGMPALTPEGSESLARGRRPLESGAPTLDPGRGRRVPSGPFMNNAHREELSPNGVETVSPAWRENSGCVSRDAELDIQPSKERPTATQSEIRGEVEDPALAGTPDLGNALPRNRGTGESHDADASRGKEWNAHSEPQAVNMEVRESLPLDGGSVPKGWKGEVGVNVCRESQAPNGETCPGPLSMRERGEGGGGEGATSEVNACSGTAASPKSDVRAADAIARTEPPPPYPPFHPFGAEPPGSRRRGSVNPVLPLIIPEPELPEGIEDFNPHEKAIYERHVLGMDVQRHLMAFERERVAAKGGLTAAEVVQRPHGTKAFVVGNPLRLRFPPTRTGKRVVFFDLEDESGLLNVTCFDDVYQRYGHAIICNPYVTVLGEVQDRDGHMAFLGHHIFPYKPNLKAETVGETPIKTADFLVG